MKLTDTHCHLDHRDFDVDRAEVLNRANAAGLIRILVPGLDLKSSKAAVRLAEQNPTVFAAVGFHPTELENWSTDSLEEIKDLADHPKVVAIGEIGLDYYWVKDADARAHQRDVLRQQLMLAAELGKPIVVHIREENDAWSGSASRDLLELLNEWKAADPTRPGVLHSYNGDLEAAQHALAMNFFIGVTGPVTYKNAAEKRSIISQLPLDDLLIETDAPYLTPEPHRGHRNEPAFVCNIADKIAEIHAKDPAEIAASTSANAERLFAWGD